MSPSDPPASMTEVSSSAYASTTHCICVIVAPRLACNAGSARLTTVPSMNARLDPRMVAASIQGATPGGQGTVVAEELRTPSSHGCPIGERHFMVHPD